MAAEPEAGRPPDGPDAVEQVQRAVLTLIGTARVALDALETLVADRRRLDELAASGRDAVSTIAAAVSGRCDDPDESPRGPRDGANERANDGEDRTGDGP